MFYKLNSYAFLDKITTDIAITKCIDLTPQIYFISILLGVTNVTQHGIYRK
jgi:hypothetical protein